MESGKQFKAALAGWAEKVGQQVDALARQTCQETSERVVKNTPVDTGFLRGSWQPSIGSYSTDAPKVGGQADVTLVCSGIAAGDVYYMVNNTAYAQRIEYGFVGEDSLGRTYDQAGRYFVRDVVATYDQIVSDVAADLGLGR